MDGKKGKSHQENGGRIKMLLMDRDRDNLDGEQARQNNPDIDEIVRISEAELEDDDVDKDEEEGAARQTYHFSQHHKQSPRAPPPRDPYDIINVENNDDHRRRHVRDDDRRMHGFRIRQQEDEESNVDIEEQEGYHQRNNFLPPQQPRRRSRRSRISEAEQYQRLNWIQDCQDRLRNFFLPLFQSNEPHPALRLEYFTKENFCQQRLPILWRPWLNCKSVGKLLLVLSIFTLILGVGLFITSSHAQEYRFHFGDECKNSRNYLRLIRSMCVFCGGNLNPHCSKVIEIPQDMRLPVYVYYELEGFHQNHRMLTKAKDNEQLSGRIFTSDMKPVSPSENCGQNYSTDSNGKIYFPCGLLANLMYNDDFTLLSPGGEEVPFRVHGIALSALTRYRFSNPPPEIVTPKDYHLRLAFKNNFVKPRDWTTEMWDHWWELGGNENERFVNWMNPSALPTMRKLYAVIDSVPKCPLGLFCKGNYTLNIEYRYDVDRFEGDKAFILARNTFFGGQNYIFASIVFVMGCLELALGLCLLQLHRKFGNDDDEDEDASDYEEDYDDFNDDEDYYNDFHHDDDDYEYYPDIFPLYEQATPIRCVYKKPPPQPPNSPTGEYLASLIEINLESKLSATQPSYKPSSEGVRGQEEELFFFYQHDQSSFQQESQFAFPNLVNDDKTVFSETDYITEEENDRDANEVSNAESYLSFGSEVLVTAAGSSSDFSYSSSELSSPTESLNSELEDEDGNSNGNSFLRNRR